MPLDDAPGRSTPSLSRMGTSELKPAAYSDEKPADLLVVQSINVQDRRRCPYPKVLLV
jgi:hypothetical protein